MAKQSAADNKLLAIGLAQNYYYCKRGKPFQSPTSLTSLDRRLCCGASGRISAIVPIYEIGRSVM